MKKILLLIPAVIMLFTGCSNNNDDIIWDFANFNVAFRVVNQAGEDLLNEEEEGNMLEDIKVVYKDKEYKWERPLKYNMPKALALRTMYSSDKDIIYLCFGEFSPQSNYKNETFTIDWGDGTTDEIKFNLYITWKGNDPTVHQAVYLNGELYSDENLLISVTK